jgi:phage recombination protein Bet
MSNALAKIEFNPEQLALIKTQIAKDCNNDELKLFLYQCTRTGLDPLTRQIYAIKRAGRMTIQTSIDGFRVIAERSGSYAGQDEPIWIDDEKGMPIKCTVTVYRFSPNGQRYAAGVGVAYFKEYYPTPMNLQKTMPHTMISKVAEALALRKAFPQDLSGLYTTDEMQQATVKTEDITYTPEEQDHFEYELWMQQNLQKLLDGSGYEGDSYSKIKASIDNDAAMNMRLYEKIKVNLEANQRDRITSGDNYNQSDISKHMAKM